MPATVTLSTTTLGASAGVSDNLIKLASTAGLKVGIYLYIDGELMRVLGLDVDPWVKVTRGMDGTAAAPHPSTATVYYGEAYQFYQTDPVGRPPAAIPVSPYINVINGTVWFAQGDATATSNRWWQKASATYGAGPLGIRTVTLDPSSST